MSNLDCYRCSDPIDRDDLGEPVLFEGEERFMCDPCNLATRILLYSRPDPPVVDDAPYQEVVFYARQLAAETVPEPPAEIVNHHEDGETDGGDAWTDPTEKIAGAETEFGSGDLIMVDFDGTLTHGDNFSWDDEQEQPREAMVEWVTHRYYAGAHIVIHTARTWDQAPVIAARLTEWGCPYHGIRCEKGGSTGYVDDKTVRPEEVLFDE